MFILKITVTPLFLRAFIHYLFIGLCTLTPCFAMAALAPSAEISGFARFIGGYLDTDGAKYQGYDDALSASQASLIGIQTDIALTPGLSVSGQLLMHSSADRDSGVEWLYMRYSPNENWQFKAGRLRTPVLRYSDVIDVGFAYPWISAPQQLYSGYLFSHYEGASARYRTRVGQVGINLEGYYGQYKDDINASDASYSANVEGLYGGIVDVMYGRLQLRFASLFAPDSDTDNAQIDPLRDAMLQAGFSRNAKVLDFKGDVDLYLMGANYETLDWFGAAEWMKINSKLEVLSTSTNYYVMVGRYFGDVQLHLTYANSRNTRKTIENEIPIGLSAQLDQLALVFDQVIGALPQDDLSTYTVGVRWDARPNVAVKLEWSHLRGDANKASYFTHIQPGFDRQANLLQMGVEWVF